MKLAEVLGRARLRDALARELNRPLIPGRPGPTEAEKRAIAARVKHCLVQRTKNEDSFSLTKDAHLRDMKQDNSV